ncbi:LytTR family DNA-binding domain-containing protein [uncultured Erythrobacter sp.]|uniref:LytTR family DNA-binding domain-containing protein n=1 Tax=uncultured Erythrobacter sp. TaxID=263913 RepID=UPI00262A14F8|nr:LytTR family DNA-binding domain-containing protein [uncultured Erythrobacter sp.]
MRVTWKHTVVGAIVAVLLAALFTFLAIYDSDRMPFQARFVFWLSTIGTGLIAATLVVPWVMNGPLRLRAPPVQLLTIAALSSLPVPLVLMSFDTGFQTGWPIANWAQQYGMSFTLSIIIVAAAYFVLRNLNGPKAESGLDTGDSTLGARKFLRRLAPKFREAELYAVSAEDHYLRVHTDLGDELILMRLLDALEELGPVQGVQAHRSWWVAENGVAAAASAGGKHSLILKSGVALPVARSRIDLVRKALPAHYSKE